MKSTDNDCNELKAVKSTNNDCNELKAIKYKTLLINGVAWPETKTSSNLENLDKFLESEKNSNSNEPWSKLDKTAKIKKLQFFAENYKLENSLSETDFTKLTSFLKDCLDRKKLQRVKDVIYDKTSGEVKSVPALFHNKQSNHFTLKNTDKHVSTIKSLAPKKVKTAKNVVVSSDSDSETELEK
jgi:hypothetical protein